ncbi:hypothetical protein J5X84_36245 [Streptosporangiaceae bacterium NEAU-GS5]|nr:hypothetical protein [Streptosporangiaceae bacterium NEAU-GS5]
MTALTCPLCGRTMATGRSTCHACERQLTQDLEAIPDLAHQLDLTETRQTRIGERGTGKPAETGLSWDERARTAHDHLDQVLSGWVTELQRDPALADGPREETASYARWLNHHRAVLLRHPAMDEALGQIRTAVKQAMWAIDLPAETWFAGPCNTPLRGEDGEETKEICQADLYARHGAKQLVCRACGSPHEIEYRYGWVMDQARDRLGTATEIARALSGFGENISASTIRWWAHDGRLGAKGADRLGKPRYRIGDVMKLVEGRDLLRGPLCARGCEHGSCRTLRGERMAA